MKSLVMDFQEKMVDKSYSITDLLRNGLIIASKLKLGDAKGWINSELYGYNDNESVPNYRNISMTVKFLNPICGWCPVVVQNQDILDILKSMELRDSIVQIERLSNGNEAYEIHFDVPLQVKKGLASQIPFETDLHYICQQTVLFTIVETVKNKLLEWILELEENGIIDNNMVFEKQQVEKAKEINTQIINIFYGDRNKIDVNQNINKE